MVDVGKDAGIAQQVRLGIFLDYSFYLCCLVFSCYCHMLFKDKCTSHCTGQ